MPEFVYTARDQQGQFQAGHLEAITEDEVAATLQQRGLIVTSLSRKQAFTGSRGAKCRTVSRLRGKVTGRDRVLFCQQLAALIEAGIPLVKSLEITGSQMESRPLLVAITQIQRDIESGRTFRDALAQHPKIFSNFWVNIVETGESSGHLDESLKELARYAEMAEKLQRKAMTALMYPLMLLVVATGAVAVFLLKIIPAFKDIFASMGLQLPAMTQAVIALSDLLRYHFLMFVGGFWLTWYGVRKAIQLPEGRSFLDGVVVKVPVFKYLFIHLQLVQFTRGLGTLLKTGVPMLLSLEIMERSATNALYARVIREVKEHVRAGKSMIEPMEEAGELFPNMVTQLIHVGEEIGALDEMLQRLTKYYEERVEEFIERLSVLFEPIAIVVMAVIIGTLVVSMFMPIFQLAAGGYKGQ